MDSINSPDFSPDKFTGFGTQSRFDGDADAMRALRRYWPTASFIEFFKSSHGADQKYDWLYIDLVVCSPGLNPKEGIAHLDVFYVKKRGAMGWERARIFYPPGRVDDVPRENVFKWLQDHEAPEVTLKTPWFAFPKRHLVE